MVVVSEPRKVLVGDGKNAKYVKECKEIFLGNKGIEKIRGFEDFVNIEYLCMNGNKLKKLNHLETCSRIKVLNAQDNQICTLKGSLSSFKFLEQLDLSNNQLRDLAKLIPQLQKYQFLNNLNLKDNPCCEEPDYRLQLVFSMPNLKVLDQHVVTPAERLKAKANIGGDVQALTVAFGTRAPLRDPAWDEKVPERSALEQELAKEASQAREAKLLREQTKELMQFRHNPHPDIPRGQSLPPNAGTRRAMEMWRSETEGGTVGAASSSGRREAAAQRTKAGGSKAEGSAYQPRDVFVLYSSRTRESELLPSGKSMPDMPVPMLGSSIEFEEKKYKTFLNRKMAGTLGQWEIDKKTLRV